jgi:hypothetical protein
LGSSARLRESATGVRPAFGTIVFISDTLGTGLLLAAPWGRAAFRSMP